jgi:hypothetical protein
MTNASVKNMFAVLSVFVIAGMLSLGAFAIVVHAQESYDYQPLDTSSYDYQPLDTTSYDYQPLDTSSYDYQPLDTASYDYQPIADCGCYSETVNGVMYTEQGGSYGSSYGGSYGGGFSMPSFSFSAPASHYSNPVIYSQPVQQQQQQQQQAGGQPINIVNNNNNVNTNTNTNYTPSVSTVVPIYQTPVQYPVQYTYPQTYTYPVYNYPTYTPVYTPTYYTPPTTYYTPSPSVSLSQIPYTGFDFGPVGNAVYWLSLLAFAAAGAYLLVYYSGNAIGFATGRLGSLSSNRIVSAPAKLVQATAKQIEKVVEPVLSPIQNLAVSEFGTRDSMVLTHSKNGSAPRIVITRT